MRQKKTIFISILIIFFANVALVWPLFLGGYTREMGSIESVFIADARFIFENFPHLSWNSLWYAGFPFHLFYTPVLPFLMVLAHALYSVVEIFYWYRIFIGLFYALTPVSFYFLVRFLTGKNLVGFLAAIIYSFLPSTGYLMPQVGNLAAIYGRAPWRLLTLILFGEGGHIVGIFFLPLALIFFIKAIRDASLKNVFLASLFTGLVALTNLIALIGFAVMLAIVLLVEFLDGDWLRKIGRAGIISLFSFGLVAFWYNFSFIKASFSIGTGGVGGSVGDAYLRAFPAIFLLAPLFFIFAIIGKKKIFKPILIALGWILIFFLSAYFWFEGRTMLLPQPNRYLPEMDMGTALLFSWGICLLVERILQQKLSRFRPILYILIILLLFYLPFRYIRQAWDLTLPHQDVSQTSEYKIASWFEDNTQEERVYASGTSAFWLNTFVDVPQIRGGNDGVANPWMLHAIYQINTGENAPEGQEGEVAVWWLRALNVSYLVVNLPSSREVFHDFRNPEKFSQVFGMEEKTRLDGDVIYKVPLKKPSLAQVVNKVDFTNLKVLKNAVDVKNLENYVNYIDPPSPPPGAGLRRGTVEFFWTGIGRAKVKADVKENEGIAVQITYDPGWRAYLDKRQISVKNDVIGFMFLDPKTTGEVEIDLAYGRTWDVWLGYFLTILSLGALAAYPKLSVLGVRLFKKTEEKWEEENEQ